MKYSWIYLSLILLDTSASANVHLTSFRLSGEQASSFFEVLKQGKDRTDIDYGDTEFVTSVRSVTVLGIKKLDVETIAYQVKARDEIPAQIMVSCENPSEPVNIYPTQCDFQIVWAFVQDGKLVLTANFATNLFNMANTTDLSKLDWDTLLDKNEGYSFNRGKVKFTCTEPNWDFDFGKPAQVIDDKCANASVTIEE